MAFDPRDRTTSRPSGEATVDEQMLKAGDVVRLRSGGPTTTVEAIEGGAARVAWPEEMPGLA
jgi:hypothetical protein